MSLKWPSNGFKKKQNQDSGGQLTDNSNWVTHVTDHGVRELYEDGDGQTTNMSHTKSPDSKWPTTIQL